MPNFTQVWCDTTTTAANLESYKEWFTSTVGLPRLFPPLIMCPKPLPGTDRVAVILQFTWFVVGVTVLLLSMHRASTTSKFGAAPPFALHRRSTMRVRAHPTTVHTPLSCIPKTLPIASVAGHVDNCGYLTSRISSRPSCESLVIHTSSKSLTTSRPNCIHAWILSSLPKHSMMLS